jgi:site-specific recombinase XerD
MKNNYLSLWIKRFLLEYLINVKNLSKNTQKSYRDTIKLILPFVAKQAKKNRIDNLLIEDLTPERIKVFLSHLETERQCDISTRNQRLAAIHALAKFIGLNNPEHVEWCRQVHLIPSKKAKKNLITYLEKSEMEALLNSPDKSTEQGLRDYRLLLFLYNTGARADEAAQLKIGDLDISYSDKNDLSTVLIRGKGNKLRRCPLWKKTVNELKNMVANRQSEESVFINRCKKPITRFGVYTMVKRHAKKISCEMPSVKNKHVSPHTIRHTTATHLLQSGVDINTIRVWLGHVSINTTNIYAEVNIEMRAKALECCEVVGEEEQKRWSDDEELMNFLNSI